MATSQNGRGLEMRKFDQLDLNYFANVTLLLYDALISYLIYASRGGNVAFLAFSVVCAATALLAAAAWLIWMRK